MPAPGRSEESSAARRQPFGVICGRDHEVHARTETPPSKCERTLGILQVPMQRRKSSGYLLFGRAVPRDVLIDDETLSASPAFTEIVVVDVFRSLGPQSFDAGNLKAIVRIGEHQVGRRYGAKPGFKPFPTLRRPRRPPFISAESQLVAEECGARRQHAAGLHRSNRPLAAYDPAHLLKEIRITIAEFLGARWLKIGNVSTVTRCRILESIPQHAEAKRRPMLVRAAKPAQQAVLAEISYISCVPVLQGHLPGVRRHASRRECPVGRSSRYSFTYRENARTDRPHPHISAKHSVVGG